MLVCSFEWFDRVGVRVGVGVGVGVGVEVRVEQEQEQEQEHEHEHEHEEILCRLEYLLAIAVQKLWCHKRPMFSAFFRTRARARTRTRTRSVFSDTTTEH